MPAKAIAESAKMRRLVEFVADVAHLADKRCDTAEALEAAGRSE